MRTIAAALLALLVAACGGGTPAGWAPAPTDPGGTAAVAGIRYTCGQVPFDPAVLDGPGGAELGADPAAVALRDHIADGGVEAEWLPRTGWILLGASPGVAEFAARDGAGELAYVSVEQHAGAWEVAGWGGCRPTAVVDGASLATFSYPPDAVAPGAATTSFDVLVTERACTGGQPMGERLLPPAIHYGETQIVIIFAARPLPGGHDCPGNPSSRVTVDLKEPVGDRQVVDGAFFPPRDPAAAQE